MEYCGWGTVFSPKQIKEINKTINKTHYKKEASHEGAQWKNLSEVKNVTYGSIKHLIQEFMDEVYSVVSYTYGYNVFPAYNGTSLTHSTYDSKDKADYDWHVDFSDIPTVDTKLTLLINLSEKSYTGGEFEILTSRQPQRIDSYNAPGSAVLFKSHILHRVLPVTSGVRKSLAYFVSGPRFQ